MIRALLEMMRLRSGPQDMPRGYAVAAALTVAYVLQGVLADRVLDETDGLERSLLATTVQFAAIGALLKIRGLGTRTPQTISALAGTGFVFGLLSLIVLSGFQPGQPQQNVAMAYLALFLWSLAVDAHIYRRALSTNLSMGVLLAVLVFAANIVLLGAVFG